MHDIRSVVMFGMPILFAGLLGACGASKSAGNGSGNRGNQGNQGKGNPTAGNRGGSNVDTIQWKDDRRTKPPIYSSGDPNVNSGSGTVPGTGTYPSGQGNSGNGSVVIVDGNGNTIPVTPTSTIPEPGMETKPTYNVAMLLPFYLDKASADSLYSKSAFALDFYAGARVAFDSLSRENGNLDLTVLDSRTDFNNLLNRYEVTHADLVIGPIEKDNIQPAAGFSTAKGITVVSPFDPTGDMLGDNPNFVQVKPSFKTHCEAITQHVRSLYRPEQVVLVGRVQDNEGARFKMFQDANNVYEQSSHAIHFQEYVVESASAGVDNLNVGAYLNANRTTVFIVPTWNEAFVGALLKKIDASPYKGNAVVYGMPQWMDMTNLNALYDRLGVRISSSTYIDTESFAVKEFKRKFSEKFGKAPNIYSFLGFDCTFYFSNALKKYGSKFAYYLDRYPQKVLHTQFNFVPVFKAGTDNFSVPVKYENKHVNILRYSDGAFRMEN